jgi:hypothetical protein
MNFGCRSLEEALAILLLNGESAATERVNAEAAPVGQVDEQAMLVRAGGVGASQSAPHTEHFARIPANSFGF